MRDLIQRGKLAFLDARVEPIPKGMTGPSQRDSYFCLKSDLVVLLWDGKSEGTKTLADYLRDQNVASLLAFL